MTQQRRTALKELQRLDQTIREAQDKVHSFDPLFAEIEEPALVLESELGKTRSRLQEMKLEERRLSLSSEEKRGRQTRLEERLGSVRNLREEAAVSAELEMIKRAVQSDEQEAMTLLDQIRRMDERLEEVEAEFAVEDGKVGPARDALLAERADAQAGLDSLTKERDAFVASMNPSELKLYDAIRRGGRSIAVAELTGDGACSFCFGVVPLQVQNEVRHGDSLIRCEACGVILAAPDPEAEVAEEDAAADADAPTDDASAADAAGDEAAAETENETTADA